MKRNTLRSLRCWQGNVKSSKQHQKFSGSYFIARSNLVLPFAFHLFIFLGADGGRWWGSFSQFLIATFRTKGKIWVAAAAAAHKRRHVKANFNIFRDMAFTLSVPPPLLLSVQFERPPIHIFSYMSDVSCPVSAVATHAILCSKSFPPGDK